ncbi:peptidylprolyl isomerase [soil metagenome]
MPASTRTARLLLAALLAAVLAAACAGGNPNVAASIDETDIPVSEVETRVAALRENPQLAQQFEADEDGTFEEQVSATVLNDLVQAQLLEDAASELGVGVSDEDVAAQREEIVEQSGGEEAFEQFLAQQGLSAEEAGRQIRLVAIQTAVQEELSGGSEVSDEDIQAVYDQQYGGEGVSARHILVESAEEAQGALDRIEGGEDFAVVAEELSIDGSAAQGGDLGLVAPGQTVPEFEEALFAAEEGEVVGPVESEFGFHVIERTPAPELADVEEEIRAGLEATAGGQEFEEFVTAQRAEVEVTVNPRFGVWDPEQGMVVPEDALGATEGPPVDPNAPPADPGAGEDPGAEPAPTPTE